MMVMRGKNFLYFNKTTQPTQQLTMMKSSGCLLLLFYSLLLSLFVFDCRAVKLNHQGTQHKLSSGTTWSCFLEEPKTKEDAERTAKDWLQTLREKTGYGAFLRITKVTKTMAMIHLSGIDKDTKLVNEVLQELPNLRFAEMDAMAHPVGKSLQENL